MNRRIEFRNAVERQKDDLIFVENVLSEDEKENTIREQWIREYKTEQCLLK